MHKISYLTERICTREVEANQHVWLSFESSDFTKWGPKIAAI